MSLGDILKASSEKGYTKLFETDWMHNKFWLKQILSGAFITITMTGLDQDMMQKNLTCKNLRDAQKNVMTSSGLFILVNIVFLSLGAALIYYAQQTGFALPVNANGVVVNDKIFPSVAYREHRSQNQESGLQRIRPHHGLDAALEGVKQDDPCGFRHDLSLGDYPV